MSRKISFRNQLDMGVIDRISLSTNKGLVGYRITKFQLLSAKPGVMDVEFVGSIFKTNETTNVTIEPDFSDNRLLGVCYYQDHNNIAYPSSSDIIFDLEKFNQDIFISISDAAGGTTRCNYYIELEQMSLDLSEQTVATLKDIRNIGV